MSRYDDKSTKRVRGVFVWKLFSLAVVCAGIVSSAKADDNEDAFMLMTGTIPIDGSFTFEVAPPRTIFSDPFKTSEGPFKVLIATLKGTGNCKYELAIETFEGAEKKATRRIARVWDVRRATAITFNNDAMTKEPAVSFTLSGKAEMLCIATMPATVLNKKCGTRLFVDRSPSLAIEEIKTAFERLKSSCPTSAR